MDNRPVIHLEHNNSSGAMRTVDEAAASRDMLPYLSPALNFTRMKLIDLNEHERQRTRLYISPPHDLAQHHGPACPAAEYSQK